MDTPDSNPPTVDSTALSDTVLDDALYQGAAITRSLAIMARLRSNDGCPWDREQTFDSIKRHTLEETYEVFDAIDRRDWPALKDELGDLLLQILFYTQMAEEAGHFSFEQVAENLNAKLIRRHPHVFGDAQANTPEDVNRTWNRVKQLEKNSRGESQTGHLDEVPHYLPAMLETEKLGARAAEVGFDWPSSDGLFAKLAEEAEELSAEVSLLASGNAKASEAVEDELGDLLFTTVNLARHLNVQPEFALRRSNRKFRARFRSMENMAGSAAALKQSTPDQLEDQWRRAKEQEQAHAPDHSNVEVS